MHFDFDAHDRGSKMKMPECQKTPGVRMSRAACSGVGFSTIDSSSKPGSPWIGAPVRR